MAPVKMSLAALAWSEPTSAGPVRPCAEQRRPAVPLSGCTYTRQPTKTLVESIVRYRKQTAASVLMHVLCDHKLVSPRELPQGCD